MTSSYSVGEEYLRALNPRGLLRCTYGDAGSERQNGGKSNQTRAGGNTPERPSWRTFVGSRQAFALQVRKTMKTGLFLPVSRFPCVRVPSRPALVGNRMTLPFILPG